MAIGTAVTAAAGLAGGAAKFFEGRKMQREAERAIESFEWQDLENPYESLQVSRLGADLRAEENARMTSTSVDALRGGGARTLAGGLGRVQAGNNIVNREIGAGLDEQQKTIDRMAAQDEAVQRAMIEKRQTDELAGYGQMMNVGMGLKYQGVDNAVNAVGAAGASLDSSMQSAMGAMTGMPTGGGSSPQIQNPPQQTTDWSNPNSASAYWGNINVG